MTKTLLLGLTGLTLIAAIASLLPPIFKSGRCLEIQDSGSNSLNAESITLAIVGDVMSHESQLAAAYNDSTKEYSFRGVFENVAPIFKECDFAIANLELTIGTKPFSGYPTFKSPKQLLFDLKSSGINILVTANNHSNDFGYPGLVSTINAIDAAGLLRTGTFVDFEDKLAHNPLILKKNGIQIAVLNYSYGTNLKDKLEPNSINFIERDSISKGIRYSQALCSDFVIIYFHWGNEYSLVPSCEQEELAKYSFEAGADLVVGSHPHVVQPIEFKKEDNELVIYSLGNFVSGQQKQFTRSGVIAILEITKSFETKLSRLRTIPTWVYNEKSINKLQYSILPIYDQVDLECSLPGKEYEKMLIGTVGISYINKIQ